MINHSPQNPSYQLSASQSESLRLYVKLMRAASSVTQRIHQNLPHGLTLTQIAVLDALYHKGELNQKELASKLLTSSGNLTLVISNLIRKGWVEKACTGRDRRYRTISLTMAGRQVFVQFMPRHAEQVEKVMSVLTSSEQERLGNLCRKVGRNSTTYDSLSQDSLVVVDGSFKTTDSIR